MRELINHFLWGGCVEEDCCCWFCPFGGIFDAIARKRFAISVKPGLSDGSDDQHLSISDFHSRSQDSGMAGLKVLLTIPPALQLIK